MLNGSWYELQPLGTEGQGTKAYPGLTPYKLTQFGVPFGIGAKISLSKILCVGLEWGMRKTYTDYLDDVSTTYPDPVLLKAQKGEIAMELSNRSIPVAGEHPVQAGVQRGNSKTRDWYSFAGLTFTVKIITQKDKGCRDQQVRHKYPDFLFE